MNYENAYLHKDVAFAQVHYSVLTFSTLRELSSESNWIQVMPDFKWSDISTNGFH